MSTLALPRMPWVLNMVDVRPIDAPFVALGPSGVAIRDRLKGLTPEDDRCCGWSASTWARWLPRISRRAARRVWITTPDTWAERKRDLTARVVLAVGRVDHQGHA